MSTLTAISFDTPKTSEIAYQQFTGTIPADHEKGYIRLTVHASNDSSSRHDYFYRTIEVNATAPAGAWHATYPIVISPKKASSDALLSLSTNFLTFTSIKANS